MLPDGDGGELLPRGAAGQRPPSTPRASAPTARVRELDDWFDMSPRRHGAVRRQRPAGAHQPGLRRAGRRRAGAAGRGARPSLRELLAWEGEAPSRLLARAPRRWCARPTCRVPGGAAAAARDRALLRHAGRAAPLHGGGRGPQRRGGARPGADADRRADGHRRRRHRDLPGIARLGAAAPARAPASRSAPAAPCRPRRPRCRSISRDIVLPESLRRVRARCSRRCARASASRCATRIRHPELGAALAADARRAGDARLGQAHDLGRHARRHRPASSAAAQRAAAARAGDDPRELAPPASPTCAATCWCAATGASRRCSASAGRGGRAQRCASCSARCRSRERSSTARSRRSQPAPSTRPSSRCRAADGVLQWYALSVRRCRSAIGGIESIAVLSDVTRLKLQQSELETLARDRELMFSLSEVGIAFLRDGRIQRANEALAQLRGCDAAALSGSSWRSCSPTAADFQRLGRARSARCASTAASAASASCAAPTARCCGCRSSKRLVRRGDPGGGIIASYVNVDDRHRAEASLAQQAERTRAILDSVLVGIVTVGRSGIEWMNRSARRMFGGELADFIGEPIATVATDEPDIRFGAPLPRRAGRRPGRDLRMPRAGARRARASGSSATPWRPGAIARGRQLTYALLDIERRRQAEAAHRRGAGLAAPHHRDGAAGDLAVRRAHASGCCRSTRRRWPRSARDRPALLGRTPEEMLSRPTSPRGCARDMQTALAATEVTQHEYRVERDGASQLWDARWLPLAAAGARAGPAAAGRHRRHRAARRAAGAARGGAGAARHAGAARCITASRTTCRASPG